MFGSRTGPEIFEILFPACHVILSNFFQKPLLRILTSSISYYSCLLFWIMLLAAAIVLEGTKDWFRVLMIMTLQNECIMLLYFINE